MPRRGADEHLQVLAVANFKGGSGKTTTSAHLAQYLALHGYKVLAIDLDPQASLSALFGVMPEIDVKANETLYAAIRYDDERRPMADIIRPTYFDGLDLVPGNLELMEFEHATPMALRKHATHDMFYTRIARALDEVADRYDVVVIDCPPHMGFLDFERPLRGDRDGGDHPSADARRVVDEPVPLDDQRSSLGRRQRRRRVAL